MCCILSDYLGGGFKYCLFSPRKLGKIPNLTNIFQMGWNHQLEKHETEFFLVFFLAMKEVSMEKNECFAYEMFCGKNSCSIFVWPLTHIFDQDRWK